MTLQVKQGGWAVLTLAKEPVNTLDLDLWQALCAFPWFRALGSQSLGSSVRY